MESILGILSGIADFSSYLTDYFRDKRIRDTQRHIDNLESQLSTMRSSLKHERNSHADKVAAIHMRYSEQIDAMADEVEELLHPRVGEREIKG